MRIGKQIDLGCAFVRFDDGKLDTGIAVCGNSRRRCYSRCHGIYDTQGFVAEGGGQ